MMQLIATGYDDCHVRKYNYGLIHSHTVCTCRHNNSSDDDDDGSVKIILKV